MSPILLLDLFQGGSYLLAGLVAFLALSTTTTQTLGRSQPHVAVDLD